jgi:hypothetical protein
MNFSPRQNEIKIKTIRCCDLTQLCAFAIQFYHDKLKESNLSENTKYFSFGAIDTI